MTKNKFVKNKKIKTNGTIDFINGQKNFLSKSIFNVVPKIGDLLIFDWKVSHFSKKNLSKKSRIAS